jgi:type II secretion system protein N
MTLLRAKKQARFQAHLADGTIKGRVIMDGADPSRRFQVESDLSQIRLEQIDVVQANDRFTLSGVLKGQITHDGGRSPQNAAGGSLSVSGLRITLKSAFYGISDLVMGQADATFSVTRQDLKVQSLTFNGPMMEGKITGTIMLRRPFGQSQLNLSGNAKPRPELFAQLQETLPMGLINAQTLGLRGLNFLVRGSVDNPDVSMR